MSITVTVNGQSGPVIAVKSGDQVGVSVGASSSSYTVGVTQAGTPGGQGPTGSTGATGPANTLTIGTVTKGDEAGATITGTAPNQVLSLTLPKGDKGDTGAACSLTVGTVTTGAAGSSASASITGTAPNQTLSLTIPRGDAGATGSTGAAGENGRQVEIQASGTHIQWRYVGDTSWSNVVSLASITGPQGSTGAAGPANSLSIGTVTTGAAGSSAAATITGTAPAQTLNLTLPKGDKGQDGGDVEFQASSTHIQWRYVGGSTWTNIVELSAITGPQGATGSTGSTGATGAAGPANSLAIGTVTTGSPGSSASASITGTAPSQTLSLTIPRGNAGADGSGVVEYATPAAFPATGTAGVVYVATDLSRFYRWDSSSVYIELGPE